MVNLDRFQPLGRVDFTLDSVDLAAAMNQYMDQTVTDTCPEEEHLANGDFTDWQTISNAIGPTKPIPLNRQPTVVAVSPDCQWIVVGNNNSEVFLSFFDPADETLVTELQPDLSSNVTSVSISKILIRPDGLRAYVQIINDFSGGVQGLLQVIDLSVPDLIGSPVDMQRPFPDAAFSPDSKRLYVAEYREGFDGESGSGILWVLDVEVWEGYQHDLSQMETPPSIALGENKEPVALAMAADGRRLYVAVFNREGEVGTDNGEIHVINTDTHENEGLLASVPEFLQDIALTPDGRQAVVTAVITGNAWANFVYIVDTVKGSVTPVNDVSNLLVPPLSGEFTEVSISSDGQRAFVVDENNEYVAVIDINRRIFTNVINLGGTPGNIAITPMGDRIYVPVETTSSSSQNNLASIPVNLQLPTDWTVTSGAVTPFCFGSPYDRLPILGLTPVAREVASSPTAMSQVAPVAACVYDFSFWGRSTGFRTVAEVIWLSDTCGLLRVDEVPIERITSPLKGQPPLIPAELTRHRAKFEAPEGATQAEIRFRVPAGEVAIVDQVSFRATLEGVANDDLQLFEEGQPANWTLSPETAHGFSLKPSDGVMELANDGFDDFDLTQTVPITAETPFTLQFLGQVIVPPVGPAWPQLELRWLKKDGAPTGTTATLELRSSDPDTSHTLSGTVPAEVTSVEVNLVVPGKTTLSVEKISLLPLELVRVPLKFMAQAPGELMVSNVHVAYDDTARAALPPIPEAGLALAHGA